MITRATNTPGNRLFKPGQAAFTLAEVLMSLGIVAVIMGGVITSYIQGAYRAEWAGYSLAAQALAVQQLEQVKSAKWDVVSYPEVNEITNVPRVTFAPLDLPRSGTNFVWATNTATISRLTINTTPSFEVYLVKIDTVWPFNRKGQLVYFTNTVASYLAPD